ncbi:TetR/AcrR family transcriptional regulator [Streptomyces sp. A1-5]|uniref:TetR/AcrR family transcriptional regulator n=1 Tax=Streptomyces sp. A1-5 TaxID=2738410 RepID=UPI001F2D514B|nr:TetR/AcrR family transcriptional regulator [Streptomyces sp. A1-5]UJB40430.1 TetR family transcriptional regulator [Streptomyces sp. A1-5]
MPPAPVDHESRREDVSQAVWRVLAAKGFGGLTLRAVAAEMDVSTGLLMHYFPTKRALVVHALELLEKSSAKRPRRARPREGLAALRAVLLDFLPIGRENTDRNRIWVSSWDLALADQGLHADQAERYVRIRAAVRPHLEAAVALGELPTTADLDQLATMAVAFVHGLVVQALFDPKRFPAKAQTATVDRFLDALRTSDAADSEHPPALLTRTATRRSASRTSGGRSAPG